MSISISMTSVVSQSTNSTNGGGSQSSIEVLQKKLASLQKDLQQAIKSQTKEGQAKAKLIQVEISATQAQLEQLIQQKAKESADKQAQNKSEGNQTSPTAKNVLSSNKTTYIDEFA